MLSVSVKAKYRQPYLKLIKYSKVFLPQHYGKSVYMYSIKQEKLLISYEKYPQLLLLQSHVQLLATPMDYSMPGFPVLHYPLSLLKLMSIELVMLSNNLIPCSPFSSCPGSFPASGSFLVSRLFASGGQSIGASASASALPMNIHG